MPKIKSAETKGAEEARNTLPALLDLAEHGQATIITKRGRPVAVLAPIADYTPHQHSILPLVGSGRGYWGKDPARTIAEMRDEWER